MKIRVPASPERWNQQNIYKYRERSMMRSWLMELAHEIMEKFHHLPSAIWSSRKADSVIQSKSKGLKTRKAIGENPSLTSKAQESTGMSPSLRAKT
jgi:hypothetical protein